jgi:hypothetical protein
MIDLILHAGTKFALHQWLDARGLGVNVQDTDAISPTFGEWSYTHTHEDTTYRCIQAHTSIVGWQPPNVPALWEVI